MEIKFLGHASFLIQTAKTDIVTDPFSSTDPNLGLKFPSGIKADIVTVSHQHHDHNNASEVRGNPYIIKEPGEFEVKGVNIFGYNSYHDESRGAKRGMNTIYLFESEEITICHLGDLGHLLDNDQVNELDGVDILMVPIGGIYTLDAKGAAEVVVQIEPKVVIPMHYGTPELKLTLNPIDQFLKEMGQENLPLQEKLVVKNPQDLGEETQVVILRSMTN